MRASEIRTRSLTPFRRSLAGMGAAPHSGIPGAPLGPTRFRTSTLVSSTGRLGSSMRAWRSAWSSKTTARPRWVRRCADAADCLSTAPSGQRLPVRITVPPSGAIGRSSGRITSSL